MILVAMRDHPLSPAAGHRSALACAVLVVSLWALLPGCGDDPAGPGPGPGPDPDGDASLEITLLTAADSLALLDSPPDWTEGDGWVLVTAGPGSIGWKIAADGLGPAAAVTDPSGFQWLNAAYTPFGLYGGGIGYFQGLVLNDFGMHLMQADTTAWEGHPTPTVLRRFASSSVGLPANQLSSPRALSVSADARRAVGTWLSTWLLDWQDMEPDPLLVVRPATGLENARDFRVDRSGERLTFVGGDGVVYWMLFNGDEAFRLSPGVHPSFSGDGSRLGYRSNNGFDYIVVDLATRATTVYVGSDAIALLRPVLSWSGDRIAFLRNREDGLGLGVAELAD